MRHAEAQERLADLALEPGRLARLGEDPSPGTIALRRHLAACEPCSAELAVWRRTWAQVGAALSDVTTADDDAVEDADAGADDATAMADGRDGVRARAALRSATLERIAAEGAVRRDSQARSTAPTQDAGHSRPNGGPTPSAEGTTPVPTQARSRRRRWAPWVAMAAALVIALGAGSLAWTRTRDLDRSQLENAGLTATMASLDRVLATPAHWTVTLRTPDGVDGGTMAWSGSEIAVITSALPGPADGQSYRCWVERDGVRTPIGPMWFSGTTGYWAGAIGGWVALLTPGSRVGVSLIPAGDGPATPVLIGSL
jgi:hypothetical protein